MSSKTRVGSDYSENINLSVTDASIQWRVFGLGGQDNITGGANNDVIFGDYGLGTYPRTGVAANDYIDGGEGNDVIYGEEGNDGIHGGDDRDTLIGGQGADVLYGDNGNDVLGGGTEDDILIGGRNDDNLSGGDGNDILVGYLTGYGDTEIQRDVLTGGEGADKFVLADRKSIGYTRGGDYDFAAILDFKRGEDKIQLKASGSFEGSGYSINYARSVYGSSEIDQLILYRGDIIGVIVDPSQSVPLNSSNFTAV